MDNSPILFENLTRAHPQLTEKALVDFVNGLEVIDDHIRYRQLTDSHFAGRLLGFVSGESAKRQHAIDQNVAASLATVSTWLQCLQKQQLHSDLAVTKIAHKLSETRQGVMRLQARHEALRQDVDKLLLAMDDMDKNFCQLSLRIEQVNDGRLASQQMDAVFSKWQAGHLQHFPVVARLFLVFDELYWGDFGNYCRQCGWQHREIARLSQQVKDRSLVQLKQDWAQAKLPTAYDWQGDTRQNLQGLATEHNGLIAYLTEDAGDVVMPLLWGLNQLADKPEKANLSVNNRIPFFLTPENALNRVSHDFEVRYASIQ